MRIRERYAVVIAAATLAMAAAVATTLLIGFRWTTEAIRDSSAEAMSQALIEQLSRRGRELAELVATSVTDPLLIDDLDTMGNIVRAVRSLDGLRDIRIYDQTGRVVHDGTPTLESYGQPAPPVIAGMVLTGREWLVDRKDGAVRVAGPVIVGGRVIGAVVLSLETADADREIAMLDHRLTAITKDRRQASLSLLFLVTAGLCAGGVAVGLMLAGRLSRPIETLTAATRRIGSGTLDLAIPVGRQDELGELARALQTLASDLRQTTVSKDYLDRIIDRMLDSLIVVDRAGAIRVVNGAASRLTGYEAAELIGAPVSLLLPAPDDSPRPADASALLDGISAIRAKDGRLIPVLATASPLTGPDEGVVCVAHDMTALKQKEAEAQAYVEALEATKAQLEQTTATLIGALDAAAAASQAKSQFLATMSHELRTPLNAIIGFAEVLRQEMFGPLGNRRYSEYAGDIRDSGAHLLEIINDILDLSKLDAGRMDLRDESVDPASLLHEMAETVRPQAADAGLTLTAEMPADLPAVRADPVRLRQVLLNLLSNAVKFTGPGGTVRLSAGTAPDGGLRIVVADTGIGIAAEDIPKAFERFGQIDSRLARCYEGTGLGLPLARMLVELHGGSLTLDSAVGVGTTVTVTLPASRLVPDRLRA